MLFLTWVEALALQNRQTVVLELLQQLHLFGQVLQFALWGAMQTDQACATPQGWPEGLPSGFHIITQCG